MSAKRCSRFKTVRGPGGRRVRRCSRYSSSSGLRSSRGRKHPRRAFKGNGARCIKRKLVFSRFWRKQVFRCSRMRWPDGTVTNVSVRSERASRAATSSPRLARSSSPVWGDSPSLIGAAAAANSRVFLRNEQLDRRIIAPGGVVLPLYRCGDSANRGLNPQTVAYLREEMGKLQPRRYVQVPVKLKSKSRARV